jgi:hypothetical protein
MSVRFPTRELSRSHSVDIDFRASGGADISALRRCSVTALACLKGGVTLLPLYFLGKESMDFTAGMYAFRQEQRERSRAIEEMPVKAHCICPNGGRPDESGNSHYSPSCQYPGHGLRSPYVVHDNSFGGFDRVIEEPPRSKSARNRPRLPVHHQDVHLTEAARQCRERLAAREATINHQPRERGTTMGSTERSMKAVGQATAEGFAKTSNQPMQNIPVPAVNGTIPAVDTARIAPTTGPCVKDVLPAVPLDKAEFGTDRPAPPLPQH